MGQRPSKYSISDDALAALQSGDIAALLNAQSVRFGGWRMEKEDDDDSENDENEDSDDAGGDDENENSEDDEDSEDDKVKNRKAKDLSEENARRRIENKRLEKEKLELAAKLKKFEDADKTELEKAQSDLNEASAKVETLIAENTELRVQNAFLTSNKHAWRNPRTALRLADLSEVEINDDGEVIGLDKALDALAKSDPYLLKGKEDEDDESPTSTGRPTGKGKKGQADRELLLKKYPALRRG